MSFKENMEKILFTTLNALQTIYYLFYHNNTSSVGTLKIFVYTAQNRTTLMYV